MIFKLNKENRSVYSAELKKRFSLIFLSAFDYFNYRILRVFRKEQPDNPQLVFIMDIAQPHILRLAELVKKETGIDVNFFTTNKNIYFGEKKDFTYEIRYFRNGWHLLIQLLKLNNILFIHGFCPFSKYYAFLIKHQNKPVIVDYKDVSVNYYGLHPNEKYLRKDLKDELFCLENASGIVGRSLEPNMASRFYNLKKKPKNLLFLEYCDHQNFVTNYKRKVDTEIHIVYIGGLSSANSKSPGNITEVIEKLSLQRIHLHVYPGQNRNWHIYADYIKIADINPYFHWHPSVKFSDLTKEISQYHFGIHPYFFDENVSYFNKAYGSTALKIYNYLEAHLPVIISSDIVFMGWMITRFEAGFVISKNELDKLSEIVKQYNYTELLDNVANARESLSLRNNLPRLFDFYKTINSSFPEIIR